MSVEINGMFITLVWKVWILKPRYKEVRPVMQTSCTLSLFEGDDHICVQELQLLRIDTELS